mmetsp:Transcript_21239/g.49237  ORF Transcript_21239/g.49237 Transcript_21239/m.49237 type:complete len:110 (+) Transcript_21239:83-412(+)
MEFAVSSGLWDCCSPQACAVASIPASEVSCRQHQLVFPEQPHLFPDLREMVVEGSDLCLAADDNHHRLYLDLFPDLREMVVEGSDLCLAADDNQHTLYLDLHLLPALAA